MTPPAWAPGAHLDALALGLRAVGEELARLERWGTHLAGVLAGGGRLLACGNGGSAAEAQHLTGELVGRYLGERPPLSAICLASDMTSSTAIGNDYGLDEVFARQVRAHGRPGDVLVCLSTSGRSPNVLAAADAAADAGLTTWAVTGARPNPLGERCHETIHLPGPTPTVQEATLVAIHLLCAAVDAALPALLGVERAGGPA